MNSWNDVKQELPHKDGWYITFENYVVNRGYFTLGLGWNKSKVTHWMDLPSAPDEYKKWMYIEHEGKQIFVEENGLDYIRENHPDAIFEMGGYLKDTHKGQADDGKSIIFLAYNCNDLFYWGCADMEIISWKDIEPMYLELQKNPRWGLTIWVCKKRGMRPQHPIEEDMKKDGLWTDELEALPVRGNTG